MSLKLEEYARLYLEKKYKVKFPMDEILEQFSLLVSSPHWYKSTLKYLLRKQVKGTEYKNNDRHMQTAVFCEHILTNSFLVFQENPKEVWSVGLLL